MKHLKKYTLLLCALTITSSIRSMENRTQQEQKEDRALVVREFDTNLPALLNDAALTAVCSMPVIHATNWGLTRVGILPSGQELETASSLRAGTALAASHIAATIVTKNVRDGLIGAGAITPHPAPSNIETLISRMAVTWGVGYILREQLDKLTKQYDKKDKLLEELTVLTCRSTMPTESGLPEGVRRWLPHDDEATQHINLVTDFSAHNEPADDQFSCYIICHKSDVQVTECMPFSYFEAIQDRFYPNAYIRDKPDDNHTVVVRSTYDTSGTFWKYYLPLGRNSFRDAMTNLNDTVRERHVTVTGQSLSKLLPSSDNSGSIDS